MTHRPRFSSCSSAALSSPTPGSPRIPLWMKPIFSHPRPDETSPRKDGGKARGSGELSAFAGGPGEPPLGAPGARFHLGRDAPAAVSPGWGCSRGRALYCRDTTRQRPTTPPRRSPFPRPRQAATTSVQGEGVSPGTASVLSRTNAPFRSLREPSERRPRPILSRHATLGGAATCREAALTKDTCDHTSPTPTPAAPCAGLFAAANVPGPATPHLKPSPPPLSPRTRSPTCGSGWRRPHPIPRHKRAPRFAPWLPPRSPTAPS